MQRKKLKVFGIIILILFCHASFGQSAADSAAPVPIFTADSLASGNYKDVLSSFFQLAVQNLTGPNKELKFTSNPYAIMLRSDSTLKRYDKYMRTKIWRKFNFALDARLDSAYHFNGFATGLTYALVNNRDFSVDRNFIAMVKKSRNDAMYARLLKVLNARAVSNNMSFLIFDTLLMRQALAASGIKDDGDAFNKAFQSKEGRLLALINRRDMEKGKIRRNKLLSDKEKQDRQATADKLCEDSTQLVLDEVAGNNDKGRKYYNAFLENLDSLQTSFQDKEFNLFNDTTLTFDKVDTLFQKWIFQDFANADESIKYLSTQVASNHKLIVAKDLHTGYDKVIAHFQQRGLWTVAVNDTSYSDGKMFKVVQLQTEYLRGMLDPTKPFGMELDLKGYVNFLDDSLQTGKNLQRQYWTVEPGLNLVCRGKRSGQSFLEFKLSGGITHVFKGYYADDKNLDVTLAGTLRLRIMNELWLPLQIKYDPQTGNVFGFLNVTTNFTGLKSMIKGK